MVSNEGHVGGCLVGWSIVLLQFPVVSPLASMCKHLVALWNEVVTQHIGVLIFCHSLVGELGFGIDVFADLFVSACHKLETCGAMIADAHIHMSNAMLGSSNSAPVAGVHHLRAGLPLVCNLKYLLSVIMTLRHEQSSLLRAVIAYLTLASFCLAGAPWGSN